MSAPLLPSTEEDSRFRVDSDVEIAYILRGLMKSGALVTLYFNGGREFVVSAVLAVEAERGFVILDSGANRELNDRLLRGGEMSVVSSQDGVRVQFACRKVEGVSFEGRLAFRIAVPDSVIKLQRREYYRLPTPLINPLKCEVPAAEGERVEMPIADISLGGVCLVGERAGEALALGSVLEGCRIVLPEAGTLQANLCVRNSYLVMLKNGASSRRTGCDFIKLGAQQEAMVQRYIIRLERERRAKSASLRG
jgi:c-di-GMP-binding flagellar brake protein YcgR